MSSPDHGTTPVPEPRPSVENHERYVEPVAAVTSLAAAPGAGSWMLLYALVFSLIGAAAAWTVGEQLMGALDPTLTLERSLSGEQLTLQNEADTKTSALIYGTLGGLLGLALGVGGGLARGSTKAAIVAGVIGLVLGLAAGALLSMAIVPIHHRQYDPDSEDLLFPLAIHAGIWGMIGLVGGLALALGLGAKSRLPAAMVGGLVGAVFGAAIYEVVGATVFPLAQTVEPFSSLSSGARFLACAAVSVGTGIGAWAGLQPGKPRKTAAIKA